MFLAVDSYWQASLSRWYRSNVATIVVPTIAINTMTAHRPRRVEWRVGESDTRYSLGGRNFRLASGKNRLVSYNNK